MSRLLPWLWLPAGIVVAAAVLRGNMPLLADPQAWLTLAVVAPCGLPLAGACRRLLRIGYPVTPRFPSGLTVFDGTGQGVAPSGKLQREPVKVVLVAVSEDPAQLKKRVDEIL